MYCTENEVCKSVISVVFLMMTDITASKGTKSAAPGGRKLDE